jgi:uncharacterized protein YegP (UPF0339 family)
VDSDKPKIELYRDKTMEFRWRLKAANGQIIGASSEGYKAQRDADHAIDLIKKGAAKAAVEDLVVRTKGGRAGSVSDGDLERTVADLPAR